MMMYLGISIFVNIILIFYLIYIYLFKGELRENNEVNSDMPPMDDCKQCLSEHKDMIEQISKLKKEITTLTSTHKSLNQAATTIRYGMDRLMQAATRSNITIN
jgi:hypothetical protein